MQIQSNLAAQSLVVPAIKPISNDSAGVEAQKQSTASALNLNVGTVVTKSESEVDSQVLSQSVEKLNKMVQGLANGLQFSVDEASKTPVVKLVDLSTKEVIRQIPTEEAISIAQAIDRFQGLLVKDKA